MTEHSEDKNIVEDQDIVVLDVDADVATENKVTESVVEIADEDTVATEDAIKEIAPELCEYGISKIKEGGFTRKQTAYIARYLKEDQVTSQKAEEEKINNLAKEFKKEELVSIGNFFSKIDVKETKEAFENLKTNRDFLLLMRGYIQTNKPLIKSQDIVNDTANTAEGVTKKITNIRSNPALYDHFNPEKEKLQKELDSLYEKLIKLEHNN